MKVLILDPCWQHAGRLFSEHGIEVVDAAQETAAAAIDFVILRSSSRLDARRLGELRAKGLKVVLRAGSGLDNIDLGYCRDNGISVSNFPGRNADSVAEVTLSYMLSAAHRLYPAAQDMRAGVFGKEKYIGRNLRTARVAFIGYGATARAAAGLLRGIGVEDIRAYRRRPDPDDVFDVPDASLQECFDADIVSLNVPLSDSTRGMVDDSLLAQSRPGLFLINVARRDIVDHAALARYLDSGHLSGYASDVLDPIADAALIRHPQVFATPHLGAQSVDCQRTIAYAILDHMRTCTPATAESSDLT